MDLKDFKEIVIDTLRSELGATDSDLDNLFDNKVKAEDKVLFNAYYAYQLSSYAEKQSLENTYRFFEKIKSLNGKV